MPSRNSKVGSSACCVKATWVFHGIGKIENDFLIATVFWSHFVFCVHSRYEMVKMGHTILHKCHLGVARNDTNGLL